MSDDLQTQFKLTGYDSRVGRIAVMTMDNGHDHTKPNVFGEGALRSLEAALDDLEAQSDVKGLLLTGKPFIFAVGADTDEFAGMDADSARAAVSAGHELFARITRLPYPTLAAINGAAMGGGVEIALHCDYRTLSTGAQAIAFPEVFLSIIPGWGGTQLTPRLLGGPDALDVIVRNALNNNRTLSPGEAFELGFADRLIDSAGFLDDSRALLEDIVAGDVTIQRDVDPAEGLDEALENIRSFVDGKVHGATPAPYRAIDLIEFAARGGSLDEGREREVDAMAELLPSRHAAASVYAFDLVQRRIRRQPWRPDAEARKLRQVGVVGAGTMGAQIASLFLRRLEVPVVVKDIDRDVLDSAREHIEGELFSRVQKGRLTEGRARFLSSLVTYTLDYDDFADADFVIEAVLEKMDLKRRILADLEAVVAPGAVLASNTSSLSIEEMADGLEHPDRVIGFHFFNPISVMQFLEIVRPPTASDEAVATGFEVSKTIRKSGVLCADTPAFILNRILMAFNAGAREAVEQGNSPQEVDAAVKGLGLPMGPFELFEFVGIQVAYHTAQTLHDAFPDRFPIDDNFRRIAESGVDGIYDHDTGELRDDVAGLIESDPDGEPLAAEEIQRRAVERAVREARIMLDDGVVADARDIDTGALLGAGFPFFMGGICKYADQTGLSEDLFGAPLVTDTDGAL